MVKCVYTSTSLPCEFCAERNIQETCVKLSGFEWNTLLKTVPTAIDSIIRTEDATLLQVVYSKRYHQYWANSVLFRNIAIMYGPEIRHSTLREAVLGYISGANFMRHQFGDSSQVHIGAVIRQLRAKLNAPSTLDVGDMCASYLLACVGPWSSEQMSTHLKGCLAMYDHLSCKVELRYQGDMLDVFGKIICSQANEWFRTESIIHPTVSTVSFRELSNLPTFEDQVQIFAGNWESPEWSAIKLSAAHILWRDFLWLEPFVLEVAKYPKKFCGDDILKTILLQIKQDICVQELHALLASVRNERETTGKSQSRATDGLAEILSGFYALEIQIRLLESADIIEAIQTSEIQDIAFKTLKWLRTWNSVPVSLRTLRIAAVALPEETDPERKFHV